MNKIIFVFSVIFFLVGFSVGKIPSRNAKIYSLDDNSVDAEWAMFKKDLTRKVLSSSEEAKKRKVFKENLKKINDHNTKYNDGIVSYEVGITPFSDMTEDEFLKFVNKSIKPNKKISSGRIINYQINTSVKIPSNVDWRTQNLVNPIKNQGGCGSCWAFSAIASIEGQYAKQTGNLVRFSEQQSNDCTYPRDGCFGGWPQDVFNNIKNINTESSYPYTSYYSGKCMNQTSTADALIEDYVEISFGYPAEEKLTDAIANIGPISVCLDVSYGFGAYKSGIYVEPEENGVPVCDIPDKFGGHCVALVGYGTENGQDYYILRNSWGEFWGDNGYMKFARNRNNQCRIGSYASFPILKNKLTTRATTTTTKPSTITPKYLGCFRDTELRDLNGYFSGISSVMTRRSCFETCNSRGFRFAGLQDSSKCLCGNRYGNYGKTNETYCAYTCTGDSSEKCGGYFTNAVFDLLPNNPPITPKVVPSPTKLNAKYLGCYRDTDVRDLSGYINGYNDRVDNQACINICLNKGFKYAGQQDRSQCFCGNTYGRYGKLDQQFCPYNCTANSMDRCGGYWSNTVYQIVK